MAATASQVILSDEVVEELLYCARAGETTDLITHLDELTEKHAGTSRDDAKRSLIEQVKDVGGNSMTHYACANGHLVTFEILSPLLSLPTILLQNSSGNTPLHWAGLNGHLPLVKALIARITELERQNPVEANRINILKHEKEAAAAAERQKQRQHDGSAAGAADAQLQQRQDDFAAQRTRAGGPDRSIWDIRNSFGRGPTSESQMNGKEDVVVYLLGCMGAGGPGGEAGFAPQPTGERVDQEADTPVEPITKRQQSSATTTQP